MHQVITFLGKYLKRTDYLWQDRVYSGEVFAKALHQFRLARGRRKNGDPFPLSRRVVAAFTPNANGQSVETPAIPLGWVLIEFKPLKKVVGVWE